MNSEELKIWFWNLYNSCYVVKHDDYTKVDFLYYDVNFVRTKKLSEVLNIDVVYPEKLVGKCLFKLDYQYKYFWINYAEIWSVFETELLYNYSEIRIMINFWLEEYDKLKVLTPMRVYYEF